MTVRAVDSDGAARTVIEDAADVAILAGSNTILTDDPISDGDRSPRATFVAVPRADLALNRGLESVGLGDEERFTVLSQDPPALTSLRADTGDDSATRVPTAIAINVVLFILLQVYGGWVVSGVTREKESRIVEVLLATTRRLMLGKIAGIGVVALIHAAMLITTALVTAAIVGIDVTDGFRAADLVIGAVWFVLGYALYCSALAAAGSLCGAPPVWAVVVSMVITAITAYGMARLAGTIFSRSVLRTGRRVPWREALRRGPDARAPAT